MRVSEVMKKRVYTIHPEATLREAVLKLLKYQISGLIVVDDEGKVVGVVSEKDVYRVLYPSYNDFYTSPEIFTNFEKQEEMIKFKSNSLVRDFMTTKVITTSPDEYVMKVGAIMLARNIHRLPVVADDGRLVGVITRGSIYQNLFKKKLKL